MESGIHTVVAKRRNRLANAALSVFLVVFRPLFLLSIFSIAAFRIWIVPRRPDRLIWGPDALINNKYHSEAMKNAGWKSETIMRAYSDNINKSDDFDKYFIDFVPKILKGGRIDKFIRPYLAFLHVFLRAKVFNIPFSGGMLGHTRLWRVEGWLLRKAKLPTVVMPYGGDHYRYSTIADVSLRYGIQTSPIQSSRNEAEISRRVDYWNRHGDVVLVGSMLDGAARWDVTIPSFVVVDVDQWWPLESYSPADGVNGVVHVVHAPNHRGFKGTEFITAAVERLKKQGLLVELRLLENVRNDDVREIMREADILAEQLLCYGFGLNGIEGMALGLPILCNLANRNYADLFHRFSFLGECPAVSCTIETFEENLRVLVTSPRLRETLGRAGRSYVSKYHSYETAQYLFGSIYKKVLDKEEVDLINLFHPLKASYNSLSPLVEHPLHRNQIPEGFAESEQEIRPAADEKPIAKTASGPQIRSAGQG